VAELPDDEEKTKLALDPIYRLEQGQASKARAVANKGRMERLREDASLKWEGSNAYEMNKALRTQLREGKRVVAREKEVGARAAHARLPACLPACPAARPRPWSPPGASAAAWARARPGPGLGPAAWLTLLGRLLACLCRRAAGAAACARAAC
jgi:hypothetical protein